MTAFVLYSTALGALLVGAVLTAAFGFPIVARRARARTAEETRVYEGVLVLAGGPQLHPLVEEALPAQFGTLVEHARLTERLPIGAEPVPAQVRDGVTGRAEGPRTSGNAAPAEVEPPPHTGGPAGSISWPLSWRLLWPVLLFVAQFWHTPIGERIDRIASSPRLYWLLGPMARWEFVTLPTAVPAPGGARHAAPDLDGEAERRRRALFEPTQEMPALYGLDPGWRKDSGEIPVAHIGELVGMAT